MLRKTPEVVIFGIVYVALLLLLGLTVEAARYDLGQWNFAAGVLIAAAKACLIGLYFMHVRHSAALIKVLIAGGLLWLAILFSLSLSDYWTRDWL